MKKIALYAFSLLVVCSLLMSSCSEATQDTTDYSYSNWQARNIAYFRDSIMAQAQDSIQEAKEIYGIDDKLWQPHCNWRIYGSLFKSHITDSLSDCIVVHFNPRHTRTTYVYGVVGSPTYNDSVRISYRGYLMPKNYGRESLSSDNYQERFTSTYYGEDNDIAARTTAPTLTTPSTFVDGFATALQYMVPGDDWTIYVPSALAYGSSTSGVVRAYSTLQFRVYLYDWYEPSYDAPEWYARKK